MSNLYFQIVAFFFAISLLVVYKLKVKVVNKETKIYYYLLLSSFFDSVFMSIIIYLGYKFPESSLIYVFNRLDYITYLAWAWCFFLYMYNISANDDESLKSKYNIVLKVTGIINFVIALLILSLKINLHNTFVEMYAYGPAVNCVYASCAIYILAIIVLLIKNYKKLINKKYAPAYTFAFMAVVLLVVRQINPSLLLIPLFLVYINLIMFFTLENPDLKMIEQLEFAKDKAEKYSNDKATFLFNITQRIRNPLTQIEEFSKEIREESDVEKIKRRVNDIALASEKIQYIVKDALDISQVDAKKINMVETKYSLKTVVSESILRLEAVIKDNEKDIKVYKNISLDIPTLLYGDPIKMKQIFNTLLLTSEKYTNSGTIECNISCIKFKDICRIIIKIEDTGSGIPNEDMDELFKNSNDETLESINNSILSLGALKKIINLIGGTINIETTPENGTEYSVVIDQKIFSEELNDVKETISKYDNYIYNKKNVLIIGKSDKELKNTCDMFSSKSYDITKTTEIAEGIASVNDEMDIIFVSEILIKDNIKDFVSKVREKETKKVPIILICESYNKDILEKYISDGITECILLPIKLKELNEIIERQIKVD